MSVSRRLRFEVLRRDNHACRYCGATAPDTPLTVDHVTPVALGGSDDPSNLVTACQPCNAGKSSTAPDAPLVDDVSADALRWAQARAAAIGAWRTHTAEREASTELVITEFLLSTEDDNILYPRQWFYDSAQSIRMWLDQGLTDDDLLGLVYSTTANPKVKPDGRWRYFCGAVWRTLDQIQADTALRLELGLDRA